MIAQPFPSMTGEGSMLENPTWQLEQYVPLLHLRARRFRLDPRLLRRFDSSDLAQEALLRAHVRLTEFRGRTEAELLTWLERILAHAVADEVRKARARKRDPALERPLPTAEDDSAPRLEAYLASGEPSPGEQVEQDEQRARLQAALDRLPEDQRDVVTRRDVQGVPVAEIAGQVGRTPKSVAGLLSRGRHRLRQLLGSPP
jgi:RNA polymerase sigma-70 factor (ECF subfamily)